MKKLYSIIILFATLFAFDAAAQFRWGPTAGVDFTNLKFKQDIFTVDSSTAFQVGVQGEKMFPGIGFGIDIAALYDYRSAKVTDPSNEDIKIKQQSINVPVNLRYGIGLGSLASIIFHAGPQIGFNVGDKNFKWTDTSNYALKKSNFSVNVGLGVSVAKHFEITGNYNIACGKTADATVLKTVQDVAGTSVKSKSRNSSWQVGLAYYF